MAFETKTPAMRGAAAPAKPQLGFVDLTRAPVSDRLIDQALVDAAARDIRAQIGDAGSLPAEIGPVIDRLVSVLARQSASIEKLHQSLEATLRDRAEMMRLDPLPFIPEGRRMPVKAQARKLELAAASPEFSGTGWYKPETNGQISWRWTQRPSGGVLVLPTLGGGKLTLSAKLMMPFGRPCNGETVTVMVNDTPLKVTWTSAQGSFATFTSNFELPQDDGLGTFALLIQSAVYEDPGHEGERDSRLLGVGLRSLVLETMAA
jgi:hypothetical protein